MSQLSYLYKTATWQKIRSAQLSKEPLCRFCSDLNRIEQATVCDHVEPHRGDLNKFYDENNLQSLCKHCHDSHKQRQEKSGLLLGCSVDGQPSDPNHHWNK